MIKPSRIVVSTWSALALVLCMSVGSAAAQQQPVAPPPAPAPAPAPGAAPATPPPGAPAVVDAPAPPPGSVYAQPTPPPYYAQQPVYAPQPYQPYPQPVPRRFRPRRGLMIGGIAMLGASYIVSVVSGAVLMDINRNSCDRCKDVGPLLFIPLAGPFLGISQAKTGDAFLVLLGILQIAGTGLTVGGVIQYQMSKKQAAEQGLYTLRLPHDRSLTFDLSTSPARLGPSARLRF